MNEDELLAGLNPLQASQQVDLDSCALTSRWQAAGVTPQDAVEPVLRFMERNPDLDLGVPGSLAHFIEKAPRGRYALALMESLARRPTALTVLLLHRLANGAATDEQREQYLDFMDTLRHHPLADADTLCKISCYLDDFDEED